MRSLRAALLGALVLIAIAALPARLGLASAIAGVDAASPAPAASADSGDTRSAGEAPGFVGSPLLAVLAVLALGGIAAGATIVYVRLTGGPSPDGSSK